MLLSCYRIVLDCYTLQKKEKKEEEDTYMICSTKQK